MKKLLVMMVLVLGALAVNAQRTPVKVSDLPKGVSDSISKEFSGYTIKESSKVVENNVTTYEVVISKGMNQKTLTFDNEGKSLKSKGAGHDMDMDKNWDKSKSKTPSSSPSTPSSSPSTPSSSPSTPSSSPSSTPSSAPSSTPGSTTPPNR
jgi:hypothetical protein